MMKPLISVVTICLNEEKVLENTITSVTEQTYKNFEYIIIDGKSTDNSLQIINRYRKYLTKYVSESDNGRYDAMNKGIKLSKGKYIIFLHAGDSFVNNNVLKSVSKFLIDDDIYFGSIYSVNKENNEKLLVDYSNNKLSLSFFREHALPHQAMFFRRDSFKKYGNYDDKFAICGDQELLYRYFVKNSKITPIPITVSNFVSGGISNDSRYIVRANYEKSQALEKQFKYPKIHFFTIVLYGEPFIRYHIEIFKKLKFDWHWHIVEGMSELKYDTSWSVSLGGKVPSDFHNRGRAIDGTSEYIDKLKKKYPSNITIYRKPLGKLWEGKIEMVCAPLKNIKEECLLWQIDADEYWTANQITRMRELYMLNPQKTASFYMAYTFIGDNLVLNSFNTYGNTLQFEWIRTWRFKPGDNWAAHEPPTLMRKDDFGNLVDVSRINPFEHIETYSNKLVFQHFSYLMEKQLKFKESYYAYHGAVKKWIELNSVKKFPVLVRKYLDWVKDETQVVTSQYLGIKPLLRRNKQGKWINDTNSEITLPNIDDFGYLLAKDIVSRTKIDNSIDQSTLNTDTHKQLLARLNTVETSKGWKLILLIRKISQKIFPTGSKRRLIISKIYHSLLNLLKSLNAK